MIERIKEFFWGILFLLNIEPGKQDLYEHDDLDRYYVIDVDDYYGSRDINDESI